MQIFPDPASLTTLTAAWSGDRFDSGRPRVPDGVLARLRTASHEQAWEVLSPAGYPRQHAEGFCESNPDRVLVGRATTSTYLPVRPDLDAAVVAAGAQQGHTAGDRQNTWVVDSLEAGDVMVADIFGKIEDGTVVGDNLGTAVANRTGAGAVIDGGVRDLAGLRELDASFFYRGTHPSAIHDVSLVAVDAPVRIGPVTVLPGDVVLGTRGGVTFIPAHLAAQVAEHAAEVAVRDEFGKSRIAAGTYRSVDIDVPRWAEHIETDFAQWRTERDANTAAAPDRTAGTNA